MATNNGGNQYATHTSSDSSGYTEAVAIIVSVVFISVLLRLICFLRALKEQGPDGTRGPSAGADAGAPPRVHQPPPAVTVELQAGPLVCTYRRADGWREATCPVCLSDFVDGETLRVLPACMHYFHAACVDEWLRTHTTCPLCRAATA